MRNLVDQDFQLYMWSCGISLWIRIRKFLLIPVAIAEGQHLFPFRTEQLSPPAPMVLLGTPGGRVGRCRIFLEAHPCGDGLFYCLTVIHEPFNFTPVDRVILMG